MPRVKIQEADAKSLLVAQGLPVPPWEVATTVDEAVAAAERFLADGARQGRDQGPGARRRPRQGRRREAGRIGGRGARRSRARSSAWTSRASRSARSSSAPAADIVKEYYLAAVLDRAARRILLMGSAEGGVEIEQVADERPGGDRPDPRRPVPGPPGLRRRGGWRSRSGLGAHLKEAVAIAQGLVRTMTANDADLVEINPLAIVRETGRGRRRRRAARLPRREGHARRLRAPPPPRARGPSRPRRGGPDGPRGARGRAHVHQARRDDRLHGQRRRARDDDDGPREAGRRRAGELPRHRRRRAGRQGRRTRCA